jgi:hypothetical protein
MKDFRWVKRVKRFCGKCEKEAYFTKQNICCKCKNSMCDSCWDKGKDEFAQMVRGDMRLLREAEFHGEYCPECFFGEFKKYVEQEKYNRHLDEIREEKEWREEEERCVEFERERAEAERVYHEAEEKGKLNIMSECPECHELDYNCDFETCDKCRKRLCSSCIKKFVHYGDGKIGTTFWVYSCGKCFETLLEKYGMKPNGEKNIEKGDSSGHDSDSFSFLDSGFDSCSFQDSGFGGDDGFGDGGFDGGGCDDSGGGGDF